MRQYLIKSSHVCRSSHKCDIIYHTVTRNEAITLYSTVWLHISESGYILSKWLDNCIISPIVYIYPANMTVSHNCDFMFRNATLFLIVKLLLWGENWFPWENVGTDKRKLSSAKLIIQSGFKCTPSFFCTQLKIHILSLRPTSYSRFVVARSLSILSANLWASICHVGGYPESLCG